MSSKPRYKHTSLGWLPEDWTCYKLKKICFDLKGGASLKPDDFTVEGVKVLPKGGILDGGLLQVGIEKQQYCSEDYAKANFRSIADKMDVILVLRDLVPAGPNIGLMVKIATDEKYVLAQGVYAFKVDESLIEEAYLIQLSNSRSYRKVMNRIMVGSTQVHITNTEFFSLELPFPDRCQQRKIAAILSTWDVAIINTQQLITQLQCRNKVLKQQLLTGKKRLKDYNKPWSEIHLAEAFNERNETGFVNLNLLSVGSLGVYPQSQSEKRDTSNSDKAKYKRICPGDIGYNTMRMWQGRSALSSIEGIVSPAYTIVTPKERQHSEFYAYLFKLPSVVNKFFRNSQGLVEDTLNCKFKDFSIVKVEVPEYEEQVAIAGVLKTAQLEVKAYEQKLIALQQQKKGLMQKILTGELRVKI